MKTVSVKQGLNEAKWNTNNFESTSTSDQFDTQLYYGGIATYLPASQCLLALLIRAATRFSSDIINLL